jgi:hypothetical protein
VDTFEYRLLREVEFRESLTRRYVGEIDAQIVTTVDRSLGPVAPPQIAQKPRNSKLAEGTDAVFQAKVTANPKPRVSILFQEMNSCCLLGIKLVHYIDDKHVSDTELHDTLPGKHLILIVFHLLFFIFVL